MKNIAKKSLFTAVWVCSSVSMAFAGGTTSSTTASSAFWVWTTALNWEADPLEVALQGYANKLFTYLYIFVVFLALYAGFLILTAAGNDDNIKKGKKILTQAAMWIIVIFLASQIAKFIIGLLA